MYYKAYSATQDQWWVSLDKERWFEYLWEPATLLEEPTVRRGFDLADQGADPSPQTWSRAALPSDLAITRMEAEEIAKKRFVVPERGTMFAHIQDLERSQTVSVTPWRDRPAQEIACRLLAHSGNAITDTAKLLDVDALELAEKLDLPSIIVAARAVLTKLDATGRGEVTLALWTPVVGELRRALDSVPARRGHDAVDADGES